jgi:hypothetical protein
VPKYHRGPYAVPIWSTQKLATHLKAFVNTEHTNFIEWNVRDVDANKLYQTFAFIECEGIIGLPRNIEIAQIPLWRAALPSCPSFKLELLFPVYFPLKSPLLGGENHQADVDNEQQGIMLALLRGLTEDPLCRDSASFYAPSAEPEHIGA